MVYTKIMFFGKEPMSSRKYFHFTYNLFIKNLKSSWLNP